MSDFTARLDPALSKDAFATLGGNRLAFEQVAFLCPDAPMLRPGLSVFVLHAADGTPILVTDTREAALANAASEQLETVSLH